MKTLIFTILIAATAIVGAAADHTRFVDPFIGTQTGADGALSGSTFPGACVPFGLVQLSPDTQYEVTWDPSSAYDYDAERIYGITHTHLSGTGCTDLLDVSIMPSVARISEKFLAAHDFSQRFSHEAEEASPGYYRVDFQDIGVRAELSATSHCGIHRYTFPPAARQVIIIDLGKTIYNGDDAYYIVEGQRRYDVLGGQLRIVNDHTVEGFRVVTGWAPLRRVFFHIEFSKPFVRHTLTDGDRGVGAGETVNGKLLRAGLEFAPGGEPLVVKVALSAVDGEGARKNFAAEAADRDFEDCRHHAHDLWQSRLATVDISGTDEQKRIFYTAMYHTLVQPNVISDVDGRYVNARGEIARETDGKPYFSTFSLWDTFRAAHPLYNLLWPGDAAAFANSMLVHRRDYGYLPIWSLWSQENYCMIGNHAIPILARAVLTGIDGVDAEQAFEAMKTSATLPHRNSPLDVWDTLGYIPEPLQSQSVSITLEQAFDDWCVGAVARFLGHHDDAERFFRRAMNYRNLFDESIGFFAPKDQKGDWIRPFDPLAYGSNGGYPFTEGNAWQYLWFVPHDPQGLIDLLGGKDKFIEKLNENFSLATPDNSHNENASGFIGQYAHGNEPSHHTAYLYTFAGRAWRTQELVNDIRERFYSAAPSGYAGNDDCGQMSAWYIFSALGFYPFNAGSDDFVPGTPLFDEAILHPAGGKTFTVRAVGRSSRSIYVKDVLLNGKRLEKNITQQEILSGGVLEFVMSDRRDDAR